MRYAAIFLVFCFLSHLEARAEGNCPSGYYPVGGGNAGWSGCAPTNSGSSGGEPANPGAYWETRWGAIAVDNGVGTYGGIEGLNSKRTAQKAAIAECKKFGGKKCKISIAYYNQCGVLASGDTYSITARGPEINETTERAVNACSKKTQNCKPYYAGCSYPERVR
jgi:hypothetical protein